MSYFKYILIFIIVFILSFLDISFFSFLDVYGATILSSFLFLIIFSLTDKTKKEYLIVSLMTILVFSIFSSLPLFMVFVGFFLTPAIIFYIREHYLPEPNLLISIIYFVLSSFLFEATLLLYVKAWTAAGILSLAWFVFLNSVLGLLLYALYLRIKKNFTLGEIKL